MTQDDTLDLLRDSARDWVSNEHPAALDHGDARKGTRDRWREMAELGWTGAAIPEESGGLGLGVRAIAIVAEALGRELVTTPLISTALVAVEALAERSEILEDIIEGRKIIALALDEDAHHGRSPAASASAMPNGWKLTGHKRFVMDGADADWFIVSALTPEPALFLVARGACEIAPLDTIDGRSMAHIQIDAVLPSGARLPGGSALIERLGDLARLGLAAEMLGAAERLFEIILDYLKTREQFGRPIGSFQALQHRAAQMLVDLDLARAVVADAVDDADRGQPLAGSAVLAKYITGQALHRVTNEAVQMHGGLGMTAEHVAGRYLKWARVSEALFGAPPWLASRFADVNGL